MAITIWKILQSADGSSMASNKLIVWIETIRNIIRLETLTVRFTENIVAKHLLITILRYFFNHHKIQPYNAVTRILFYQDYWG